MADNAAVLNIEINADGADKAKRSLADLAAQGGKTEKSIGGVGDGAKQSSASIQSMAGSIRGLIGAYASLQSVIGLIKISDEYTKLTAQLKLATRSQDEFNESYSNVQTISKRAQVSLSETATLYARISNSTRELGANQATVSAITESIALGLKVSGASAGEASSAMLQLSQAFASGVLRGEEFNAVAEAAPRLMQALADGMNKPVGQLRAMAAEGQLTSDIVGNALVGSLQKLKVEAESTQTISGGFTDLKNQVTLTIGELDKATGAGKAFADALKSIGDSGAISAVFKTLFVAGANIAYVFKQVGNEIGGIAAQLVALATLDFKGAVSIGDMMKADAVAARIEIDRLTESILNPAVKDSAVVGEVVTLARATGEATLSAKKLAAATKAVKDIETERKRVSEEYFAIQKAGVDAEYEYAQTLRDSRRAVEDLVSAASGQLIQAQDELDLLLLGKEGIQAREIARLEETKSIYDSNLAFAQANGYAQDGIDLIKAQVEEYRKLIEVRKQTFGAEANAATIKANKDERVSAAKKANDEIIADSKKMSDDINRSLTDALLRGFESGKSFAKNFRDTLVNMFKTLILKPIIEWAVSPVSAAMAGVLGTSTANATGALGSVSGSGGGISSAKGIFDAISVFGKSTNASIIGGIESVGAYIADGFGQLGMDIGGFIGSNSAAIADGFAYAGALLALTQGKYATAAGTAIGTWFGGPIGGAVGGFVGGLVDSLFGGGFGGQEDPNARTTSTYTNGARTSRSIGNQSGGTLDYGLANGLGSIQDAFSNSLTALLGAFGKSTSIYLTSQVRAGDIFQVAMAGSVNGVGIGIDGWDGQSSNLTQFAEVALGRGLSNAIQSIDLSASIKALFAGITDSTKVTSMINATIGLVNAQDTLSASFGLTVDKAAQVAKATGLVGDSLTDFISQLIAVSGKSQSGAAQILLSARGTLQSLLGQDLPSTLAGFDAIIKSVDKSNAAGINKVVQLLNVRAGFEQYTSAIDSLKGGVKGALMGVVSASDRQSMLNADLDKAFNILGIAVPSSIEDLIALGRSIDYTSISGLELASVFPSLVTAFVSTKGAVDSLMDSLRDVNEFTSEIDFNRYKGLAKNYGTGFANSYQDGQSVAYTNSSNTPVSTLTVTPSNNTTISTSDPNLLQAITTLTAQVIALQAAANLSATHAKRAADVLVNVSPNGNALQTEAVA